MEVRIKAVHFDASEKLVAFINKKAERLSRHNVNLTDIDFTLRVVKPESAMNKEVVLRVIEPQFEDLVSTKVADSFEEAVDMAIEAVERPLEKRKGQR